jgi:hypothetical protein
MRKLSILALAVAVAALDAQVLIAEELQPQVLRLDERPVVHDLDLSDATFENAIDRLRTLTGANIVVHWGALEGAGVGKTTPVKVRLWDVKPNAALSAILACVQPDITVPLAWDERDGIVTVSTTDDLRSGWTKVYDVRDLLQAMGAKPGVSKGQAAEEEVARTSAEVEDELARIIVETVEPESWRDNGGTVGSIRYFAGWFLVTQNFEGHRKVERLLHELRQGFIEKDKHPATFPSAPTPSVPPRAAG